MKNENNKLDSLIVTNNGFIVEKDTLGVDNFNQIKGIKIFFLLILYLLFIKIWS